MLYQPCTLTVVFGCSRCNGGAERGKGREGGRRRGMSVRENRNDISVVSVMLGCVSSCLFPCLYLFPLPSLFLSLLTCLLCLPLPRIINSPSPSLLHHHHHSLSTTSPSLHHHHDYCSFITSAPPHLSQAPASPPSRIHHSTVTLPLGCIKKAVQTSGKRGLLGILII